MSVNDYLDGILEDDLAQLELQSRRQFTPTVHIHHLLSNAYPRIIFHLHASVPISSSFLGSTLPTSLFGPSSSPAQAGCCRYNPSNAALPSTVRLLPACSVGTLICLSRTTNLPLSRRLSITASTVIGEERCHKETPCHFYQEQHQRNQVYAGRSMTSRWPELIKSIGNRVRPQARSAG